MFHSIVGLHFVLKLLSFGRAVLYLKGMLWTSCEMQTPVPINMKENRNSQVLCFISSGQVL